MKLKVFLSRIIRDHVFILKLHREELPFQALKYIPNARS